MAGVLHIDAHHHLWRYSSEEYGWISEDMRVLRRDFLPADLHLAMRNTAIARTVVVQARQTLEETRWLLALAEENDWMSGVVGWVPLSSAEAPELISALKQETKLRAVRHVVQAEPVGFLDGEDFNRGIAQLTHAGLAYDLLIYQHQMEEATRLVDRHPNQQFVLDHCAKPLIASGEVEPWKTRLSELAERPNVCCKLSGLVTEADWQRWSLDDLRPYLDAVLQCFGPTRLMAGSDWPVCLVASSYGRWWAALNEYLSSLSEVERLHIFGETCSRVYRLEEAAE